MKSQIFLLFLIFLFLINTGCKDANDPGFLNPNTWVILLIDDCDEKGLPNAALLAESACFLNSGGNTFSSEFVATTNEGELTYSHMENCDEEMDTLFLLTLRLDEYPNKYFFGLSSSIYVPGTTAFNKSEILRIKPSLDLEVVFQPEPNSLNDKIVYVGLASVIFEHKNQQVFQDVYTNSVNFTGPDTLQFKGIRNSPFNVLTTIVSRSGILDTVRTEFETNCSLDLEVVLKY